MWFEKIWNGLMFMLCRLVYLFIKWLYQVFEAVSKANLFTEEVFDELTGRIYLIMGIAMLFIFAYNLVLMIINPDDKKGSGAMGKVVKETIISLIAVVLLPTIFSYMYTFQNHVVSSNILGQLILGGTGTGVQDPSECDEGDYECKCNFSFLSNGAEIQTECNNYRNLTSSKRGANLVPVTIFSAFYRPANFSLNECANHLANGDNSVIDASGDDHDICVQYYTSYQMSKYTGKISYLIDNDDLKDGIYEDPQLMEFDHIFALLAGVLAVWMFLCYAMEIGVRVFKLGVLQLISPIPVMMRVVPGQKEKMYDKWFKELLNTYLDVFIRLIIIYFALFAVSLVPEMIETLWSSIADGDSNPFVKLLAMVIVILGILKFAQEAPELIKTFFGNSGRFSIKPSDQTQLKRAAGMLTGGAMNAYGNHYKRTHDANGNKLKLSKKEKFGAAMSTMGGLFGGARRGLVHGAKAKDWASFKDEMKYAKNETDLARQRRLDNKELPYKAAKIPLIGGAIARGQDNIESFKSFMRKDGSSQVSLDATADAKKFIEAALSQYVNKASVEAVDKQRQAVTDAVGKALSGMNVQIGGRSYKRMDMDENGKEWIDSAGTKFSRDEIDKKIDDYYKDYKRGKVAENMMKDARTYFDNMHSEMENMSTQLNKLGGEFSTNLMGKLSDELGKLPKDIATQMGEMKIGDVTSLNATLQKLETNFNDKSGRLSDADKREIGKVLYGLADTMKTEFTNEGNRLQNKVMQDKKK